MDIEARCSFCGKRASSVMRLIEGGGLQASGELPVVRICDECIELSYYILKSPESEATAPVWLPVIHKSRSYEWSIVPTRVEGEPMILLSVRLTDGSWSGGWVLPAGTEVTEATTVSVIDQLMDDL